MPNPTRQEIIATHEALEDLDDTACNLVEDQDNKDLWELWKKRILAAPLLRKTSTPQRMDSRTPR